MSDQDVAAVPIKPTKETYGRLQFAYDLFNKNLFGSQLPDCLITLQRRKRSYGFFCSNRFGREDGKTTDEIALNPSHFRERPLKEILATLLHEMVHLWQHHNGIPGRGRYHNREFAEKMKQVGLQPTATGEDDGKETGERMDHLVVPAGAFDRLATMMISRGFEIPWIERPPIDPNAAPETAGEEQPSSKESKSGKRVKYVCSQDGCKQNLYSRHDAEFDCGRHKVPMVPAE